MIPRIKELIALDDYILRVAFDDGKIVLYDVKDDIRDIPSYKDLMIIKGLFERPSIDESRTIVSWTDGIDLPSDSIYEHGKTVVLIERREACDVKTDCDKG